jgi:RimJ/RimL family protein N-acetyltransferase
VTSTPLPVIAPDVLPVPATPTVPALSLRPWHPADVAALVEACRDPVLRRWTSLSVENDEDGLRWVRSQRRGWEAGERFAFAAFEAQPGAERGRLVGHVVLKEVAPGRQSAEVGYWTAAHARGRGVAPRALDALTTWAFDTFGTVGPVGLQRLELLHQEDNVASCRVAHKSGYELDRVLPAAPPEFHRGAHVHVRHKNRNV